MVRGRLNVRGLEGLRSFPINIDSEVVVGVAERYDDGSNYVCRLKRLGLEEPGIRKKADWF